MIDFQFNLVIDGWGISCEIAHRYMSLHLTGDKSTLVQVMAWCHDDAAIRQHLSQSWPRLMLPYDITRPQWVNAKHVPWPCSEVSYWPSFSGPFPAVSPEYSIYHPGKTNWLLHISNSKLLLLFVCFRKCSGNASFIVSEQMFLMCSSMV